MYSNRFLMVRLATSRPFIAIRRQSTKPARKVLRTLTNPIQDKKPNFASLSEAVSRIPSGSNIFVHTCAGTPTELLKEMCAQVDSGKLSDLHLSHILLVGDIPWNNEKFHGKIRSNCLFIDGGTRNLVKEGKIRSNCLFIDGGTRNLVKEGHADYTPIFLSDSATLYSSFALPVDVALITVSPIDEHGYCTLGVSADCSVSAVRAAQKIIAMVNESMPRTFGDTIIHCSHIDTLVNARQPIHSKNVSELTTTETEQKIGRLIAENLVDDGATLQIGNEIEKEVRGRILAGSDERKASHQNRRPREHPGLDHLYYDRGKVSKVVTSTQDNTIDKILEATLLLFAVGHGLEFIPQRGIGAIPDSVLSAMRHHRELGVHTEMFSDGVIDLIEKNVITNSRKTVDVGKVVATFAFGTSKFYRFIDNNPLFVFKSCGYTNDPQLIKRHHKMTAINSAIEVDLTGQIVSDSIGASFYSGFGGQTDFVYGSAVAEDGQGKSIIALASTTAKGQSKIVPFIKEGAGVVATRGHSRYIVTEYGIANTWGKSVRRRAYELIQIAHPNHRERLEKAAFERLKCMPSKD
ncbi:4-hydroxybutyrate coenzyme A transferase [Toxocara canis]|uniref:4-hydroxybutyrate coenzyme A transferase n=1 Tax=Toxocara canis TaxID=6265 RepID=A0A0B2VY71_TOXCA|nr:4-hydroxybutyrate coenzyme A transferase [Toxocara canis]